MASASEDSRLKGSGRRFQGFAGTIVRGCPKTPSWAIIPGLSRLQSKTHMSAFSSRSTSLHFAVENWSGTKHLVHRQQASPTCATLATVRSKQPWPEGATCAI